MFHAVAAASFPDFHGFNIFSLTYFSLYYPSRAFGFYLFTGTKPSQNNHQYHEITIRHHMAIQSSTITRQIVILNCYYGYR